MRAQSLFQFTLLFLAVIIANMAVISYDAVYFEQPTLYAANQLIQNYADLVNVYLHPRLLHVAIPFFRPSGHFLVYQLITPFLGWQHTKVFILINLLFLALSGFYLIKIYERLFPTFRWGGYIAFSIYAMHPALHLSRLTVMHFEFAYIFFNLLSLYLFIRFCDANQQNNRISHLFYLAGSLFAYIISITFKEPALMLAPVLAVYLLLNRNFSKRHLREVMMLIAICMITMGIYLTLPWPTMSHPLRTVDFGNSFAAANIFLQTLFGFKFTIIPIGSLPNADITWRKIIFPDIVSYTLWVLLALVMLSNVLAFLTRSVHRNSLIFLWISSLIFLALPLMWGLGFPWHLSQTLACMSLLMGFGVEYFTKRNAKAIGAIALVVLSMTILVDSQNIKSYQSLKYTRNQENMSFGFALNRNAISHPPDIKHKLNADSIIIIEDSILRDDYMLGNSVYPYSLSISRPGFKFIDKMQNSFFTQFHIYYNAHLFQWAYQMPTLREEVYPFRVDYMQYVPNEVIYNWLVNYQNIFCFGYDRQAKWHDLTNNFKTNLLAEQARRQLTLSNYDIVPAILFEGDVLDVKDLPYKDHQLCQYACDQNPLCKGYNYIYSDFNHHKVMQCKFYNTITNNKKFCAACTGYIKSTPSWMTV